MTNADKYLKDGEAGNFVQAFSCWYYGITRELENADKMLVQFLKAETKPTLTEDERVILRNIDKEWKEIRKRNYNLELLKDVDGLRHIYDFKMYNHLFRFIKEKEEYEIKELLEEK